MAQKITDKLVRELEAPSKGNAITYDTEIKGFGVRITAAGAKAFVLNYRIGARERRYTIGKYPAWSVAAARDEAKGLRRRVDLGEDPMGERHADRAAPTVGDLIDRFEEEHVAKKRCSTAAEYKRILATFVRPKIGKHKVAGIEIDDFERLHNEMKDRPYVANRMLAIVSKMMNLAVRWRMRPDNPVRGIERYQEDKRERFLSQAEIARLSEALAEHSNKTAADVIRFLMLTGARKSEALTATWDQFDLEKGVWTKPSAHTKQAKEHRVPLSAPALDLLTGLERRGEYVFGTRSDKPYRNLGTDWRGIRRAAGLDDVRVHDLRHSYASILASQGLSLPIIGQLLGHTQTQTTARYAHLFDEPLREATERVGAVVAMAGKAEAEVIPIRKGRGRVN